MDWPLALKDYRRRHALTQAALADVLNVDPTTVSRWERGRDQPALGIQRRLRTLVMPRTSDVERSLRLLIDTSDHLVVLFDCNFRLLYSSPKHRALLRLDPSEIYGRPFYRVQSAAQAALLDAVGGPRGWWRNGVVKLAGTLLRKPFEKARNPRAFAQKGEAWSIRDGVESPLVLAITHEIAVADYRPSCEFITLDDAIRTTGGSWPPDAPLAHQPEPPRG
jgi:DNA-binding XRE family transcriptional regulator